MPIIFYMAFQQNHISILKISYPSLYLSYKNKKVPFKIFIFNFNSCNKKNQLHNYHLVPSVVHLWTLRNKPPSQLNYFSLVVNNMASKKANMKQWHSTVAKLKRADLDAIKLGKAYNWRGSCRYLLFPHFFLESTQLLLLQMLHIRVRHPEHLCET